MKIFYQSSLILFFYLFCCSTATFGQLQPQNFNPKQIRKLPKIEAIVDGKRLPESYLYGMQKGKLVVLMDISSNKESPIYVQTEVPLESYDYLLISNKREARKNP